MAFTDTQVRLLKAKLDPKHIRTRNSNGSTLSYVEEASDLAQPPVIAAQAAAGATVTVTQAGSVPGTAVVEVSQTGKTTASYKIQFVRGELTPRTISASVSQVQASKMIDSSAYSAWKASGQQTITLDTGFVQKINHVEINWAFDNPKTLRYTVETSSDTATWRKTFEGLSTSVRALQWASFTTGAVNARYIRITVNSDGNAGPVSIADIRAYGDNASHSGTSPTTPKFTLGITSNFPSIEVTKSKTLTYSLRLPSGQAAATGQYPILFKTSDPSIASVSSTGVVKGLKKGSVNIAVVASVPGQVLYDVQTIEIADVTQQVLLPSADAHVQGGTVADTNYQRSTQMFVRHVDAYPQFDRYAYLSFDLTGIDPSLVESASLRFTGVVTDTAGDSVTVNAHAVSAPWAASTLTFNTKPPMGVPVGAVVVDKTSQVRTMDLTDYVRLTAGGVSSVGLTEDAPAGGTGLLVAIDSSRSANKPQLVLTLRTTPVP